MTSRLLEPVNAFRHGHFLLIRVICAIERFEMLLIHWERAVVLGEAVFINADVALAGVGLVAFVLATGIFYNYP
jgi:hypothetical protein